MQATIAAARARFADDGARCPVSGPRRDGWPMWMAAAAVSLAAIAVVAVLMPSPDAPQLAGRDPATRGEEREPAAPPRRLAEPPPAPTAEPPGIIMGARPPQALPPANAELLAAARHDFDGFQIIERDTADGVALSLLRGGTETAFDRRSLDPGIGFELLDAFLLAPADAPELLLLQSRIGDATNWDVFTVGPGGLRLSGELSRRVHDAPDRAAATRRLSAPE
ncbi:hypothetical protein CYR75_15275 (plasmid) [Paracoccus jeotgali]|uniref:Uncharacterized protein n=2 Tax=Paracoccus jeotgali TaxID=2065379 RepID=A0A2K9MJI8_9RHOB|nr:hypothetical protein CYR75_15275 [Paracoccus jeotgali]